MADSLPVLTFHALDDGPPPLSFPPSLFARGIARLAAAGRRTLDLAEAAALLRGGGAFPAGSLVITFDDGYRSVFDAAFPVLREHGMTATVFVCPDDAGARPRKGDERPMLAWDQMREMAAAGIRFGAHGLTHADLTGLGPAEAEREIRLSREALGESLAVPVECFAYPYGRSGDAARQAAGRHFVCACTDRLGLVSPGSDPLALPRVDVHYLRSEWRFALVGTPLLPWYLAARAVPRRARRLLRAR